MEPLGRFLKYSMESLGSILKAPLEFSSGKPLACGLGFAFRKHLGDHQCTP